TWKIGSVDARFDMDNDSLKSIVQSVSDLWSEAAGYPVIAYDPDGEVELNLYYTDQQQYTEDEQQLSDRIERLRQKFYAQNLMYQRQENSFENEQTEFNKKQAEYNAVVEAYNQTLSRIQTTGVRSRELDDRLKKLGREIDMKEADLASMREDLREQDAELRNLSNRLNSRANSVNELVYQYKKRFSGWRTFYQGVYLDVGGKRKINIYQFDDVGRLKLILAHEFGHALGLKHVGNPKSVMYYLTDRQNTADLQLSEEDIREIQFRCVL
ncbi:MAG: matrixin family metalloprotease, partial [Balneolaceae bacterium]